MSEIEYFYMLTVRWIDPRSGLVATVGAQHVIKLDPTMTARMKYAACLANLIEHHHRGGFKVPVDLASPVFFSLEPDQPDKDALEVTIQAVCNNIAEQIRDYSDLRSEYSSETKAVLHTAAQIAENYLDSP